MGYHDEFDDPDITARWWLDRGRPERAAALLGPGDSLVTDAAEHRALAAELRARGLHCLHENGETWVWTPEQAAELAAEARGEPGDIGAAGGILPLAGALEDGPRPPRRGGRAGSSKPAGKSRTNR